MLKIQGLLFNLFFIFCFTFQGLASDLEVHFINVGQGDSIFILTPEGKKVLVDAGGHSGEDDIHNPFNYLRALKKKGKIEDLVVDVAIITHPHDDHYKGFKYLCAPEEDRSDFFIANLFYSVDDLQAYGRFSDCLEFLAGKAQFFGPVSVRGPPIHLGEGVEFTVFHPLDHVEKAARDKNEDSVVIKVQYGKVGFLLMGDAPSKVERKLLGEEIESKVLKLGHHGARNSSDSDFLNRVREGSRTFYAVISANDNDGKGKMYGHPHRETLERLRQLKGIRLYRTDKNGHIVFTTDGKKIRVKTEKKILFPWELWEPGKVSSDSKEPLSASTIRLAEEPPSP